MSLGGIHLFEIPSGRLRFHAVPPFANDYWYFGWIAASVVDLDGDGVVDLAVGEDHLGSHAPGRVSLVSGKDRRILREIRRPFTQD